MPRIEAATVAEHRRRRRRQVVDNAAALLVAAGPAAVTPAAVARASGLARSSVYQYFPTGAELVAAAVEESFARAATRLDEAVRVVGDCPRAGLAAYAATALDVAIEGHHEVNPADLPGLPEPCRERLRQLHRDMAAPLVDVVRRWGIPDPHRASMFVLGVVNQAITMVEHGTDRGIALEQAEAFIVGALDRLARTDAPGEPD